jgi:hypothetical protein
MRETQLRYRAIFTGLIFVIILCALTPSNNIRLQNSPIAGGHFPLASFGCFLFLLLLVNPILSRIRTSWRFALHEILLIWAMVTAATGIAYTGLFRTFLINITTPAWHALTTPSGPGQPGSALLPQSLFVWEQNVVRPLYTGLEGGIDLSWWQIISRIPWGAWAIPMLWWGLFIILIYMAMIGMVGIFSHQWIDNEKMNFPLLRVLEIMSEEAEENRLLEFLTHRYFLVGISIPVFLHLLNGFHTYYPQVPQIPTLILAQPYIPREGLLSGFYKTKLYIYPAFIGFAFLASKQVSFSLLFFFFFGGLLPGLLQIAGWRLPAAALGTTFGPVLSRVEEMQMVGAFLIFFLFILWLARQHLKVVMLSLMGRQPLDDIQYHGFLSPRPAAILFFIGIIGVVAWLVSFGMDLLSAFLFIGVSFMLQLVAARLICQGGLPYFTLAVAPLDGFLSFLNSRLIPGLSLYLGAVVQKVAFLDLRESLTPSLFHSSKLADGSYPQRRFLYGIIWAIGVGLMVSCIAMLALHYKFGINTLADEWAIQSGRRVHENVIQLLNYPEAHKPWSMIFTITGAVVMFLLVMGYHLFIWWPLHPIGYLVTYSSAMQILWFSFFVGWLCNTLILRYGGIGSFTQARRFFIGLIVGDATMAILWLIAGLFLQVSYHVLPL